MSDHSERVVPFDSQAKRAVAQFSETRDRQLLTILFTDLVDSTKQQAELGDVEASRLSDLHRQILRDELAKYDAREIDWAGDSCLAVFAKPSDAVSFALGVQAEHRRARKREPKLPPVRMGIHLGEILIKKEKQKEDLFGLQVSEAARVMSVARGNQIYCTRAVFDNARASLKGSTIEGVGPVVWLEHGSYELKGVGRPVEICEVGENDLAPLKPPATTDKCRAAMQENIAVSAATTFAPRSEKPLWQRYRKALGIGGIAGVAIAAVLIFALAARFGASPQQRPPAVTLDTPQTASEPPKEPVVSLMSVQDAPITPPGFGTVALALSPDGKHLVYTGQVDGESMLVLRSMENQLETRVLPGTEGASSPFFSPDGQWVGFFAQRLLKKISITGGSPVVLGDGQFDVLASWGEDGYILYLPRAFDGIHRIHENGGNPEKVTEIRVNEVAHVTPAHLPGADAIMFASSPRPDIEAASLIIHPLDDREPYVLATGALRPVYVSTGHIVYVQKGRLMAQPFNIETLEPIGEPSVVPEEYITDPEAMPMQFALSKNGTFVYAPGGSQSELAFSRELVWIDRERNEEPLLAPIRGYYAPRVSPDGLRVVSALISPGEPTDIWVLDVARGALSPLTNSEASDTVPQWLPDGRVIFSSTRDGTWFNLYLVNPSELNAEPSRLTTGDEQHLAANPSPDGHTIFFSLQTPESGYDVAAFDLESPDEIDVLISSPANDGNALLSSNGRWLLYVSAATGEQEVYVVRYPELRDRIAVSTAGGREPAWSPDGSEIYYRNGNKMMAVSVKEIDGELTLSTPFELFDKPFYVDPLLSRSYDVAPDGRFLIMRQIEEERLSKGHTELVVVTNWFERLKKYAPVRAEAP